MKRSCVILVGLLAAAFLAGCGGSAETTAGSTATTVAEKTAKKKTPPPRPEITVSLDGRMGAENVGLLMAEKQGYFEDAGIDVWIGSPVRPRRPVTYVADETDQLAVAQLPQVAVARDKGAPVVAVGSVISQPTEAMIWLRGSGIRDIADLAGKKIAVPGIPFQEDFLRHLLARAGLRPEDVEIEHAGFKLVPALLHGKADAIFGGSWNLEGAALESRGAEPVIRRVQSLGLPGYDELVVVARSDGIAAKPRLVRRFMAAVKRGTAAAVRHPGVAAKVVEDSPEGNPNSTRREIEAQLEATLPVLSRTGRISPRRAHRLVLWMHRQGLATRTSSVVSPLARRHVQHP